MIYNTMYMIRIILAFTQIEHTFLKGNKNEKKQR